MSPERPDGAEPIADRLLESVTRLVLSSFGPAGAILGEAVSFARSIHDDGQAAAAANALAQRLGTIDERLARLEASGAAVRITEERAQILADAVRHANAHVVGYRDVDELMGQLGIAAKVCREAIQELDDCGLVLTYLSGNRSTGYSGISARPGTFVALISQVVPGVLVELEIGELLDVFRTSVSPHWVPSEEFGNRGIPIPRVQHFMEYLKEEGFIELHGSGASVEQLMFSHVELKSRGRRVLRGDEDL